MPSPSVPLPVQALGMARIWNKTMPTSMQAKSKHLVPVGGNGAHTFVLSKDLAMAVRKERLAREWSQSDLANMTGLSVRTIQELETHHSQYIREETIARIEEALGGSFDKIRPPERVKANRGTCTAEGCSCAQKARGLCAKHYQADRRKRSRVEKE